MKIRVIRVDKQAETAELELARQRHSVALLPVAGVEDCYVFYGVLYRVHPKDEHLVQMPTQLRRAQPSEANSRTKPGDWIVPKPPKKGDAQPVAVTWLKVHRSADY